MNVQVLEFLVDRRGAMAEQNLQEAIRLRTRLNTPMMRIWHHHLEPFKPMNKMQVLISPPVNDTAIATLLNTMEGSNQTSSLPLTLVKSTLLLLTPPSNHWQEMLQIIWRHWWT